MARPSLSAALPALVILGLALAAAHANDTAIGGSGASLGPVEETRAAMRSEHIRIRLLDNGFHVSATYRLANLLDEPLNLRIGFPEYACNPEWSDCMEGVRQAFEEMHTTVRGVTVPPVIEETGAESPWAEDYPRLWTFAITFAPREEVEVVHTYRVVPSMDSLGHLHMAYVVRTGANWGAPIGRAEFELDLPADTCGAGAMGVDSAAVIPWQAAPDRVSASEDDPRPVVSGGHPLHPRRDPETGRWRMRWAYEDWVPTEDFALQVVPWSACVHHLGCPLPWLPDAPDERAAEIRGATESWSPDQLRVCRNLAWAVTGYAFTSADLREQFYARDARAVLGELSLPHAADPGWRDARLTPAMRAYAALLREIERAQRGAAPLP